MDATLSLLPYIFALLQIFSSGVGAAPGFVQVVCAASNNTGTGLASQSCSSSTNVTAGDALVACLSFDCPGACTPTLNNSISDTLNNGGWRIGEQPYNWGSSTSDEAQCFVHPNSAGGADTITITYGNSGGAAYGGFGVYEWSNINATNPVDQGNTNGSGVGTAASSGAATLATSNEILLGGLISGVTSSFTAGSGYTLLANQGDNPNIEYKVSPSGSQTVTGTAGASGNWTAFLLSLFPRGYTTPTPIWTNNEPAGFNAVTDESWSANPHAGWTVFSNTTNCTIGSDTGAPYSPPGIASLKIPAGFTSGSAPCTSGYTFAAGGYTQVYVAFYLKLSSNWQDATDNDANKIMYLHSADNNWSVYLDYYGAAFPLAPQVVPQGTWGQTLWTGSYVVNNDATWHKWEVLLTSRAAGASTSSIRMWLDGTLQVNTDAAQFSATGNGTKFGNVVQDPVWGGGGITANADMFQYVDHTYASVAP